MGCFLYLTISRPDITFVVNKLSYFVSKPCDIHLAYAHHILRYLKATPGHVFLFMSLIFNFELFSYVDWGSCLDTHRSVTSLCLFLEDSLISWKAKKQPALSRSSPKAKYRALASTTIELLWIAQFLIFRFLFLNPL